MIFLCCILEVFEQERKRYCSNLIHLPYIGTRSLYEPQRDHEKSHVPTVNS